MKRWISLLLIFSLLAAGALATAEAPGELTLGYLAPYDGEDGRSALTSGAFAYAAEQRGAKTVILRYDPAPLPVDEEDAAAPEETAAPEDPAVLALAGMIEDGVDGVVVVPTSLEQAVALVDLASNSGVPIVVEGMDLSAAYPPPAGSDAPEELPYVASVGYGDSLGYAATMWMDEFADNPLMLYCALPQGDPARQSGVSRALGDVEYLELADAIHASANAPEAGREVVDLMFNSYTLFYCVLADSAPLAAGCAAALRDADEFMPIAVMDDSPEALVLLESGDVVMVASAPASVEGVQSFKALWDYLADGALPEEEYRRVALAPVIVTASERSGWIAGDDFETAYALAYPEVVPEE